MKVVNVTDLQDFLERDWRLIEKAKSDFWVARKAATTPSAAIELAEGLRQYIRSIKPDWPNSAERDADLAMHVRVAGMLRNASQNRTR
jgi:hypothetical protein